MQTCSGVAGPFTSLEPMNVRDTYILHVRQESKIRVVQMNCLRCTAVARWTDYVSNEEAKKRPDKKVLLSTIQKR